MEVRQQFLGSLAPYGYRYVTKDQAANKGGYLEVIPDQASIVRQMFQWVDKEGLSARKVMGRLNDLDIRPSKGGRTWGKSSVMRILRCETYTGVWHYNKFESYAPAAGQRREYRRTAKYKLRQRPREEWIRVELPEHLRIIKRELKRRPSLIAQGTRPRSVKRLRRRRQTPGRKWDSGYMHNFCIKLLRFARRSVSLCPS